MLGQQLAPANARSALVVALHCSGAGASQWRQLRDALGAKFDVVAPEHYGCDSAGPWSGAHAFSLADEAVRTLELIDRTDSKIHLVGHSYGGGLALHVALARPERIASVSLYEPSAFHLLKDLDPVARKAFEEIATVSASTGSGIVSGDYRGAAVVFIDYWCGAGAFAGLRPDVQTALIRWMPKAPLDFRALMEEATSLSDYAEFTFPVLVMRGEHAPAPTKQIAELLEHVLPDVRVSMVEGAGHMGPLSHAEAVASEIAEFIRQNEQPSKQTVLSTSGGAISAV